MLSLCILKGWSTTGYNQLDHPLQQEMLKVIASVTDLVQADIRIGIDGCGVPVFGLPLYNMAIAYARLSRPEGLAKKARVKALRQICSAMISHPFYVAGTNRLDTILMEVTGGRLVAKLGAEAVYCVGLVNEGMALCLKIEDGNYRALDPVVVGTMHNLGWLTEEEFVRLQPWSCPPIKNHLGKVVGHLEFAVNASQ